MVYLFEVIPEVFLSRKCMYEISHDDGKYTIMALLGFSNMLTLQTSPSRFHRSQAVKAPKVAKLAMMHAYVKLSLQSST